MTLSLRPDPKARAVMNAVNKHDRQLNNTGSCTLQANATSTVVEDGRVLSNALVLLLPKTASAKAADASCFVQVGLRQFVIQHAASSATDQHFGYVIFGIG